MCISLTHPLHHLDRARRAGHDPGAQRATGRTSAKSGSAELGDEHRRHAVERRCSARPATAAQRRRRVEAGRRDDHAGAVRGAARGCPSPCRSSGRTAPGCRPGRPRCSGSRSPMKKPLLRMLWWRQRRALGEAGRAGGVLDVDRVVEGQRRPARSASALAGQPRSRRRASSASQSGRAEVDHPLQVRAARPRTSSTIAAVVAGLEATRR